MTNPPFGFGPGSGDGGGQPPGGDPLGGLFGSGNPGDLGAALHRFADLMSWQGGPVNWDLAKQTALAAAGAADPGTTAADAAAIAEAIRLADVWLDGGTALPSGVTGTEAWSRRRWVEATLEVWRELVDPIAARVVDAMGTALGSSMGAALGGLTGGELPPEIARALPSGMAGGQVPDLSQLTGPLLGMLRQMGGAMFGTQVGQALGSLATEVVSATDVGLPLGPPGRAALLPANVAAFGEGLSVPADEVRIYLAMREAAHHRLFGSVGWLRSRLLGAVEEYARGISVDMDALQAAVAELDPTDPAAMQEALTGGMFEPQTSPEQQAALARLETLLALVEGWVDEVVATAATGHLPAAGALRETVRRRRASGGPAEETFATLVGLELRPRRLREAAALWQALGAARGTDARDAVWGHPDLLPTPADLEDPASYAAGTEDLDLSSLHNTTAPPEEDRPAT
ncbi:MAG: zinc-dependent metalloprotease [Frankiaceae bacterium]